MYLKFSTLLLMIFLATSCENDAAFGINLDTPASDIVYHQFERFTIFYNTDSKKFHSIQHEKPISLPEVVVLVKERSTGGLEIIGTGGKSYLYTIGNEGSNESTPIIGWSKFHGPNREKALLAKNREGDQKSTSDDSSIFDLGITDDDLDAILCVCRSTTNEGGTLISVDEACDSGGVGSTWCEREIGGQVVDVGIVEYCKVKCHPGNYACCIDDPDGN
ncbi:hypothetical protein FUA23_11935 [Neolewinella aurantiaca]|uniref:Uncharacterized protein n=1 Tax=Neolewinella aurantiaca TaxID=2602767 RepID=A0A5C7FWG1_9BACT|nr:hypothetical protein [Neolewinella aurantiaca]TXF89214.1 hypothetical protein FUA23_11935 [Neolewinella aurantiaca]